MSLFVTARRAMRTNVDRALYMVLSVSWSCAPRHAHRSATHDSTHQTSTYCFLGAQHLFPLSHQLLGRCSARLLSIVERAQRV